MKASAGEPEGQSQWPHQPVLYHEIIHAMQPINGGFYLDGTVGAGGHAWGILDASRPTGQLIGMDVDPTAVELAHQRLSEFGDRFSLVHASYVTIRQQLAAKGWDGLEGIVLDLGASSMQFDQPDRGFSFRLDGPLDMRFDPMVGDDAAYLVNNLAVRELADIIYRYGDERQSRSIARAIVSARPIRTTRQLVDVITKAVKKKSGRIHPATRTFQALRIAVNGELDTLERALPAAITSLNSGGRLAVISFHSLEDRIVKRFFRRQSEDCICPPNQPVCICDHEASVKRITRKPIKAEEIEINRNPRARSARLRVVEKI